jgi:hypothetical protein
MKFRNRVTLLHVAYVACWIQYPLPHALRCLFVNHYSRCTVLQTLVDKSQLDSLKYTEWPQDTSSEIMAATRVRRTQRVASAATIVSPVAVSVAVSPWPTKLRRSPRAQRGLSRFSSNSGLIIGNAYVVSGSVRRPWRISY